MPLYEVEQETERVILVGVSQQDGDDAEDSVAELAELVETAGAVVVGTLIQKRENIHPGTYVGTGKVFELEELIEETGATGIVCDDELSPAQLKNLEEALKREIYEESGVEVTVRKLVGIYSNVQQTIWHDGKTPVPTKITLDFICDYTDGVPRISNETSEVVWMKPSEALKLFTHPVFSLRLKNFLDFKGEIFYHSFTSQPYEHLFSDKF